jgi:hypothetical protein
MAKRLRQEEIFKDEQDTPDDPVSSQDEPSHEVLLKNDLRATRLELIKALIHLNFIQKTVLPSLPEDHRAQILEEIESRAFLIQKLKQIHLNDL